MHKIYFLHKPGY